MNLQQLYGLADTKSYYSRTPDEIYAALNAASKKLYLWASREFRGYFFKTDLTTVAFAAGQQVYALPPDCRIILKFGEQTAGTAGMPYRWMRPADINSDYFELLETEPLAGSVGSGPSSDFVFYGPYLDQADALPPPNQPGMPGDQVRSVQISPIPQQAYATKLIYIAEFLEIVGPQSFVMMPMESHEAILDFAVEELVRPNGDAMLSSAFEASGTKKFQEDFLPWMRMNQQVQTPLNQEPYLEDMD